MGSGEVQQVARCGFLLPRNLIRTVYVCVCMFVQAHVRIWHSISLNTLKVLGLGLFERAVCCLAFSKLVRPYYQSLHAQDKVLIFTALHGMQTRSCDENSVCSSVRLSVCLSVCPSLCLSNACIVTKQKKNLSRFLYHAKDHSVYFYEKKNGWWGRPLVPKILGQPALVGAKSPILNQ